MQSTARSVALAESPERLRGRLFGAQAGITALTLLILMFWSAAASAAPKAELWDRWTAHNPASNVTVDHSVWDALTKRYLSRRADGIAVVSYGRFSAEDKRALAGYIAGLAAIPVSTLNRDEQMAYWLNLYNALTVKVILDHYPVRSIRDIDISPGFFANGPWGAKLVRVEGAEISLDDIEHRILRPIWKDPRIHYSVNCAAIGCPDLKAGANTAATLDIDLEGAAAAYINHPRGVSFDRGRLVVSSIYDWFDEDFGGNDTGVIAHIKHYAGPSLLARLARVGSIYDDEYDWTLNDQAPPKSIEDVVRRRRSFGGGRGS